MFEYLQMNHTLDRLAEVFRDIDGHKQSSKIIRTYSYNKQDIREVALNGIDFKNVKQVIDIGCGFGFFSEAFCKRGEAGTIISGIDCFEEYRDIYLQMCLKCGSEAKFYNNGHNALSTFKPNSVNLVLCSFSLYFFPSVLPQLCRILKESGISIFITHSESHLKELTQLVLEIIHSNGFPEINILPHDELIKKFSGENGEMQLLKYFDKVERRNYFNELVFTNRSIGEFIHYFRYKKSFFFPTELLSDYNLITEVENELISYVNKHKKIRISKNDVIFICSKPNLHNSSIDESY